MRKPLVIFGVGKIAEVIFYYAKEVCGFEVIAFSVNHPYKHSDKFQNLPVVSFENIESHYPPTEYDMFIAIGYHNMNALRETRCNQAIAKGYQLVSVIGDHTHLPLNVTVGWNCFIMPPSMIHPCVSIKNNVFIWSGALVGHHSVIEDNCWLTSCCNISGDVIMGANTFVAVNATIAHSVKIGKNCLLGANTLVIKDLEDGNVVISESTKPLRITSKQFLKISNFSNL